MRKIKEVLRLRYVCGLSEREIAASCRVAHSTVSNYLKRAEKAGLGWPEAGELSEVELGARLFAASHPSPGDRRPPPDCQYIHEELRSHRKVNLTLTQLWLEYKERHPDGYQYTQFCRHYRAWQRHLDVVMRQEHRQIKSYMEQIHDALGREPWDSIRGISDSLTRVLTDHNTKEESILYPWIDQSVSEKERAEAMTILRRSVIDSKLMKRRRHFNP